VVLLADRLAGWFVGVVLVLAIVVYVVWLERDPARAMDNAIALLVVTCPCALAMATPLAVTVALGRAAQGGMLIRGGEAIEMLSRPSRLFLDKTGTITQARTSLLYWDGPSWVRPLVLALERESTHPVAEGFRLAFRGEREVMAEWSRHTVGGGIEGGVSGHRLIVGAPAFVSAAIAASEAPRGGNAWGVPDALTPVLVAVDGALVARAGFGDPVRADSEAAVEALRRRGWRVSVLSGDDEPVVARVAREIGVSPGEAIARATPETKLAVVQQAAREGRVVMVGDGVNDAGAIAAASVGIGVHGGAEACLASADVYLTTPGLGPLVSLTDGAARTMRVIRRNIAFSLAYNLVGAALAMTGVITPLIAAIMMPASSLTVVIASWYSRTFDPVAPSRSSPVPPPSSLGT
jgi:Cu2+-exporting ATPase